MNVELEFYTPSKENLRLSAVGLTVEGSETETPEYRLEAIASPAVYKQIDRDGLFNLKTETRLPLQGGTFQSDGEVQLQLSLKSDRVPQLLQKAKTEDEAIAYLQHLSQRLSQPPQDPQPDAALLDTESWLCLSVSQVQASGEVSYRTLWSYLNPDTLASDTPDTEQLSQGILAFISDFTEASLGQVSESFSREILDAASQFVGEVDESLDDNHSENRSDRHAAKEPQRSLLETTIGFFLEDDWSFQRLEGRSVLQLGFEGENGRWSCFAKAREPQQQLVFYSICPVEVPETQRQEMSEFLTRANYGLVIGNFEMDFEDGEIRYKTSLDVENDVLSSALVKNLVYPNLLTMDKYLRGIAAVAKGEMTPTEAIDWVESSSE